MRTSCLSFLSAAGSDPLTSAKPPVLISGKASEVTNKIRNLTESNFLRLLVESNDAVHHTDRIVPNQGAIGVTTKNKTKGF